MVIMSKIAKTRSWASKYGKKAIKARINIVDYTAICWGAEAPRTKQGFLGEKVPFLVLAI